MPKILNKRLDGIPSGAVYCGRGSPYGNPFVIGVWWNVKKRQMTRDDVCDRFRDEVLPNLDVSALRGKDLVCWCAPQRCHCDSIIKKVNG